jgi:ATP-dependent Clp protease ATP-binding subunit ClpX
MIPEFLGRLPILFTLEGLTKDMLVKVLYEPRNAIIKQYKKLLALDELSLYLHRRLWKHSDKAMGEEDRSQSIKGNS